MNDIGKIEAFLYDEAALLDNPDLDGWMELYTPDGTYWMPVDENQADPINHISLFYDDRVMMEVRRRNFQALLYYRNEQRAYGGTYEHHLVPERDTFKIRHKKVVLINCDAPQRSLTVYL